VAPNKIVEKHARMIRECTKRLEDESVFDHGPGNDFAVGCIEKLESLMTWIEQEGYLTPKQLQMVNNIDRAIDKWLHY